MSAITELKNEEKFNVKGLYLGCSYGFDFNYESANNISIFNAIKVGSFDTKLSTSVYDNFPLENHKLNYCFLDFKASDNTDG
ncbi:hypothetical protein [Enterovibrio nigricans]|uniref:hypothetical protein n=1 Tax=Enterovibrio nigricans TaxID=504469 RepID=UPI0011164393|nr:hypothetical protein [Enterovibrio nigricans]